MYVSDLLGNKGGSVGILVGTCFSDHAPILLVVTKNPWHLSPTLRIPDKLQVDDALVEALEGVWQEI